MKNLIIILLLSVSLTANAQEKKTKCVTVKVEKLEEHKVKVVTINKCKNIITVKTMLKREWISSQKKRKARQEKNKNK
tara:strand:+ start:20961 stop:21194 length:234 start_codon:yes stop_codon:yes gene_type:complete